MSKMIEKLKNDIVYYEEQIESLEVLLTCANEQIEKVGKHSEVEFVRDKIKKSLESMKNAKQQAEKNEQFYTSFKRDTPIEVMFFEAYHKYFKSEELEQMHSELQQFSATPFMKTINTYSSDEGILYASENIDLAVAQAIWDYIKEFEHDEDTDELNWEWGDLLLWDGTEITKK